MKSTTATYTLSEHEILSKRIQPIIQPYLLRMRINALQVCVVNMRIPCIFLFFMKNIPSGARSISPRLHTAHKIKILCMLHFQPNIE